MTDVVVDASAGVEMALRTQTGRQLSGRLAGGGVYVSESFYTEAAGVLRRMLARGEITAERAQQALADLLALETHRVSVKPLISEAWELRHNVIVADAVYVVVARRFGCVLLTGDQRLAGAPNLGITVTTA